MKKNKKINNVALVETKQEPYIPGSVKEFKELLNVFPDDAKFTLNGSIDIDFEPDEGGCDIYPKLNEAADIEDSAYENVDRGGINFNLPIADESEDVMKVYLTGIAHDNNSFMTCIREIPADTLVNAPIMTPNPEQLTFEKSLLPSNQVSMLSEIRHHNAYIAECLGELHRREIAALLEYNTQCFAHFGIENNKTMCEIVDNAINAYDTCSRPL